jgi:hypothetical protein
MTMRPLSEEEKIRTMRPDDNDKIPDRIWIPTYGTDRLFDDWFNADDGEPCEDDVEYVRLSPGENIWTCDGCKIRGIVPPTWKHVPGWTWDDAGKWYCPECGTKMGLF